MPVQKSAPTPYATLKLPVGEGHTLHLEESGNPSGIPVLILHGGPGGSLSESNHLRFPPNLYRLIAFDQRGCGKSTSKKGPLHANTTQHLIADIEKIRTYLNIEKWVVAGASWGSTLALAYAEKHPTHVLGLLLNSIFLGRREEIEWFTHPQGMARFYPQEYANLMALTAATPATLSQKSLTLLTGKNKALAHKVAHGWTLLESLACSHNPNRAEIEKYIAAQGPAMLTSAQIEVHYFAHNYFLKPNQLLKNISKIQHIPTFIAHGALDFVCPPATAHALHAALPHSTFTLLPMVGHYGYPAMDKARRAAAIALAKKLKSSSPNPPQKKQRAGK